MRPVRHSSHSNSPPTPAPHLEQEGEHDDAILIFGRLRHVRIVWVAVRHVHLHVIGLGVEEVLRPALLQRAPVEVQQFEDVGTLEGAPKQERSLLLVIEGIFNWDGGEGS